MIYNVQFIFTDFCRTILVLILFMGKQEGNPQAALNRFCLGGFQVLSTDVLEVEENYSLVKGNELTVVNPEGEVIHGGATAFIFLNDETHLVRKKDKTWWMCDAKGQLKKKTALRKKNIILGNAAMMLDERGKLRLGQQSPQYSVLSY